MMFDRIFALVCTVVLVVAALAATNCQAPAPATPTPVATSPLATPVATSPLPTSTATPTDAATPRPTKTPKPLPTLRPTPTATPEPLFLFHKVEPRDTLWGLSEMYLGAGWLYPHIYQANRSLIVDPDIIEVGWILEIPLHISEDY